MESPEARHRFAHAAEQVEKLQQQIADYKSALDAIQEASDSAGEVASASEDLAIAYMETKSQQISFAATVTEVRDDLLSLQNKIRQSQNELDSIGNELRSSLQENLTEEVNKIKGAVRDVTLIDQERLSDLVEQVRWLSIATVVLTIVIVGVLFFDRDQNSTPSVSDTYTQNILGIEDVQIQVLNGEGEDNLASQTADFLSQKGVTVANVGNITTAPFQRTEIHLHAQATEAARKIASWLGVERSRIFTGLRIPGGSDITIVIGKDFASLTPFRSETE